MKNKTLITHKLGISFYAMLVAVIFCGCNEKQPNKIDEKEFQLKQGYEMMERYNLQVMVIDSCEYLYAYQGGYAGIILTHKGNCKFCRERSKK